MTQWKFTAFADHGQQPQETAELLAKFGRDGWELVCIFPLQHGNREFWFKQPIPERDRK